MCVHAYIIKPRAAEPGGGGARGARGAIGGAQLPPNFMLQEPTLLAKYYSQQH